MNSFPRIGRYRRISSTSKIHIRLGPWISLFIFAYFISYFALRASGVLFHSVTYGTLYGERIYSHDIQHKVTTPTDPLSPLVAICETIYFPLIFAESQFWKGHPRKYQLQDENSA